MTMFPTDRRAGVWTEVEECLEEMMSIRELREAKRVSRSTSKSGGVCVHKQINQSSADSGLDDGLDFVVGPIREVLQKERDGSSQFGLISSA